MAKTLLLLELARLSDTFYCLGPATSKSGLAEVLWYQRPRFLLCDEIGKFVNRDTTVLLSVAETGIIKEVKIGKQRELRLSTNIFAASNRTAGMTSELLSRFRILYLPEYSREQFVEASKLVLTQRGGVNTDLASYIAERSWELSKDVRECLRIGKICRTREEVDADIELLCKYAKRR